MVILNDGGELSRTNGLEDLRIYDGILMGIMGFNSFPMKKFKILQLKIFSFVILECSLTTNSRERGMLKKLYVPLLSTDSMN